MTGENLKALRKAKNMTREQYAEWLGDCTASTLNKWERDISPVPHWVIEKALSNVQITLPLNDLSALVDHCNKTGQDFQELLSSIISGYLNKPKAQVISYKTTNEDPQSIVAEDPPSAL